MTEKVTKKIEIPIPNALFDLFVMFCVHFTAYCSYRCVTQPNLELGDI